MSKPGAAALIKEDFVPTTDAEFKLALQNPLWRLNNLYFITTKGEGDGNDGSEDRVVKFKMNAAQRRLALKLWFRNIIPKARQLGFTTFSCILALDYSVFNDNFQSGIIADTKAKAIKIMSDKILFAYNRLPESIRKVRTLIKQNSEELKFNNNSSIIVSTSMRSGTTHFLHISEYGKICARSPDQAKEVMTGSLPTVPTSGIVIIESTAEGKFGDFHDKTMKAKANHDSGKKLNIKNYRMHFYPWFEGPDYKMDPRDVVITDDDHDYFDSVEAKSGIELSIKQRAWYCETRENDFSGDDQMMWQEYPSTVEEAFQVSSQGCWFTKQMTAARKEKRITKLPIIKSVPCMTFWDIGASDGTAIWVVQKIGHEFRCIEFFEDWDGTYEDATKWLQGLGLMWDKMYLPHDAGHKRQGKTVNLSPCEMLEELMPGADFVVLDRIDLLVTGIIQTRNAFPLFYFDETRCKKGIDHLDAYHKKYNHRSETWTDDAEKADGHSESADALRQLGQAIASGEIITTTKPKSLGKPKRAGWRVV